MAVDATPGGASSDSYVSEAEVAAYWTNRNVSAWAAASAPEQEAALREATLYLDGKYDWVGSISATTQALNWPRSNAYDSQGRELTGIPVKLKQACYELALQALSGNLVDPSADRGGHTKMEKVGDIQVEYFSGASTQKLYAFVDMLLKGLSINSGATVSVVRA